MSLPTPRQLLTTLLTTLQAESQSALSASTPSPGPSTTTTTTTTTNPLKSLPESAKDLLLTLSHLLPTFVPALDLLDHRHVRRCRPSPHSRRFAYFVVSGPGPGSVVVVRPAAWWCACRAFASAAFGSGKSGGGGGGGGGGNEGYDGGWGGRMLGDGNVPVCMHLVACVLVEECPSLFGGFVEEVEVDLERWVEIELEGRWGGGG